MEADPKDLLGHSNESPDSVEDTGDPEGTPLRELKSIVLSLDWEITDQTMSRFVKEIDRLKDTYRDDTASKLLNSAYMSLEKVIVSKDITGPERKKILVNQLRSFKRLKEQIALRKAASDRKKELKPSEQISPMAEELRNDLPMQRQGRVPDETKGRLRESDEGRVSPPEGFMSALEEIKQLIQDEFRALRKDLKQWRYDEHGRT